MKRGLIPQEILLATATIFFQKRLSEKIASENSCLSYIGKLEEAFRNGVLDDMLPESMEKSTTGKTLFTWDIRYNKSFLQIGLCDSVVKDEKRFSIDPFLFLPILLSNS
ncbi:MAG: hypothetical protein WKG06_24640 [Segetibacter sp.]